MKNRLQTLILILSIISFPAFAAQLPPGFAEIKIAEGLDPVSMTMAPDGRIFIAEKNGRVRIIKNEELLPDPFLEVEVDNYNERGMSGIVLDPGFEINNFFYLFYTVPGGNYNRVSRFTANGDYALPNSETILFEMDFLAGTIHNAGALQFGPDGKLYISAGDGADFTNGQNLNTTLGKILRINPDGSIPEDNPFYDQLVGDNRAIWAYGFRNPFSMAIQPETGRVFIGDVGSSSYEEVNEVLKGKNYGWAVLEGQLSGQMPPPDYVDPVYAYDHDTGCAVVGATFYNPETPQFPPEYMGRYFFADYCLGYIKMMDPNDGSSVETFATGIDRPLQMMVAPDGSMYYIERRGLGGGSMTDNTSTDNGVLWRIFYTGSGAPFISSQPEPVLLPEGEDAFFSVSASGAQPLQFQWQKDGVDIPGADAPQLLYPSVTISDDGSQFRCRVSNGEGEAWSEAALLLVTTNQRPDPVILSPEEGTTYRAGELIAFSGSASDPEEGELAPAQLSWRIEFHHDDHSHPAMAPVSGIPSGNYNIPIIGETADNVWYRIYLTATDSEGLSRTIYREVFPEKSTITIQSDPPGLMLNVDGQSVSTPHTFQSVIGILRNIQAPPAQVLGNEFYAFHQWSTGSADPVLEFQAAEADETYLALYDAVQIGNGTGLRGAYYNEVEHIFAGEPELTRIDTTVHFDWAEGTPAPGLIAPDFFSVQWTGEVQTLFSETYTFYVVSDDGIRLWVDDQLVINQWVPQPATETAGTISLQGGQRYPIRLDYFEDAGAAVCILMWQSPRTPKEIIPKRQLYPDAMTPLKDTNPHQIKMIVFPQPASDKLKVAFTGGVEGEGRLRLYDLHGRRVMNEPVFFETTDPVIELETEGLPAGMYLLEVIGSFGRMGRKLVLATSHQ